MSLLVPLCKDSRKIKDKMNKFKSFILFKGLDNDFKEYEQEKDFSSLEVEHSSNHIYFDR